MFTQQSQRSFSTSGTSQNSTLESFPDLVKLLKQQREQRNFNPAKWVEQKTDMINSYMRDAQLKACVLSVSGGVDSSVALALLMKSKEKKNSPIQRVIGITQPIHSTEKIWKRALELSYLGAEMISVDQTAVHDQLVQSVDKAIGIKGGLFATGQLKSYQRTPVAFYAAQLLSQEKLPAIVVGTGNYDEDGYLCYFCKAGDGVVDIGILADLHKSEVFSVGHELKLPSSILSAPPSADLWEGQTDEGELGFSYDFVELYTEYLRYSAEKQQDFRKQCSNEAWEFFTKTGQTAAEVHRRNKHKLHYPVNLNIMPVDYHPQ